jgi:DNA polymerase-3 subunit delta
MGESARFFIFHGKDEFTQAETLRRLKSDLGDPAMVDLNTSYFNGATVRLGELMHACSTVPFLAEKRLVVVEGLLEHLDGTGREKDRDALLEYLPQLPASTRLVLLESHTLSPQNRFIRLANSTPAGYERAFHIPKGWALERWIVRRVEFHGGAIHPHAAALLAADVGEDLRLLEMEIIKLLTFVNFARPIQPDDVQLLTPYVAEADIFALVDAIGQQQGKTAATLLRRKLEAGEEPLYLLGMITRQIRLLTQVREKMDQGYRLDQVADEVNIHPYVAEKLARQVMNFHLRQLEDIHRQLLETDVAIKTGQIDPAVALDLLVVEVAS